MTVPISAWTAPELTRLSGAIDDLAGSTSQTLPTQTPVETSVARVYAELESAGSLPLLGQLMPAATRLARKLHAIRPQGQVVLDAGGNPGTAAFRGLLRIRQARHPSEALNAAMEALDAYQRQTPEAIALDIAVEAFEAALDYATPDKIAGFLTSTDAGRGLATYLLASAREAEQCAERLSDRLPQQLGEHPFLAVLIENTEFAAITEALETTPDISLADVRADRAIAAALKALSEYAFQVSEIPLSEALAAFRRALASAPADEIANALTSTQSGKDHAASTRTLIRAADEMAAMIAPESELAKLQQTPFHTTLTETPEFAVLTGAINGTSRTSLTDPGAAGPVAPGFA